MSRTGWLLALAALLTAGAVVVVSREARPREVGHPPPSTVSSTAAGRAPPSAVNRNVASRRGEPVRSARHETSALRDEATLMADLRAIGEADPTMSLELARDGNARFPESSDAAERGWIAVKSLVNLGRFPEARAEARSLVLRSPGTSWALDVARHLLSHPP